MYKIRVTLVTVIRAKSEKEDQMKWHEEELDVILVPAGLLIMFGYHLFLLYRYLKHYKTTALGFENHCRKAWVKKLMQIDAMSRGPAFTMMNSTITAVNFMASTSLTLSSLIGAWVGSTSSNEIVTRIIYGDARISIASIKYISILLFFLLAFVCFVQSSRCYVQAILLLSIPRAEVPEEFVLEATIHGANFWQVGLRAIYFAIIMLMWIFGPIPMFLSSVVMMVSLYVLDVNSKSLHHEFKETTGNINDQRKKTVATDCNPGHQATAADTAVLYTAVGY